MSTQPNFNHSELKDYSIPKHDWELMKALRDGDNVTHCYAANLARRVITFNQGDKILEVFYEDRLSKPTVEITYSVSSKVEKFFDNEGQCLYKRTTFKGKDVGEQWFKHDNECVAFRNTVRGVLSCRIRPAVVIIRDNFIRREEDWVDGVLLRVRLISTESGSVLVKQEWSEGKCVSQTVEGRCEHVLAKDLALPLFPVKVPEEAPKKKFSVTSAGEMKKKFFDENDLIRQTLEQFETRVFEEAHAGNRTFELIVPSSIYEKIAGILKDAGYSVHLKATMIESLLTQDKVQVSY
jgi:hypothetical protein